MTSKYFSLILLFSLLISCGKLNIQDSCNCELEKSTLAEMEAELIELKERLAASTKIPEKTFSEYSLLTKTKWEEIIMFLLIIVFEILLSPFSLHMRIPIWLSLFGTP